MQQKITLPAAFVQRMQALLGADAPQFFEAMQAEPQRALRINRIKIQPGQLDAVVPFETCPISFDACGRYFSFDGIGNTPLHHAGAFYVQEPAAMAAAAAIDPKPDWKILDLCAAPGGKTARVASFLDEKGVLIANEIIPSRMKVLTSNVERLGFRNVITTCCTPQQICLQYPNTFDLVIADVPCSGEGMLRKSREAVEQWSEENILMCAARAAEILDHAATAVAANGYLLFSTCTFAVEENEQQVASFLQRHPDFSLMPVSEGVRAVTVPGISMNGCSADLSLTRRFYPHISRGEGQYVALLRRDSAAPQYLPRADRKQPVALTAAEQKQVLDALDGLVDADLFKKMRRYKDTVILPPTALPLPNGAFCCGVTVGTFQKNYFLPHHQFFSAYGSSMTRKLDLSEDDPRLSAYLRGETFACELPDGWCAVLAEGAALGGAKAVKGQLKNHYPKGLRIF